LCRSLSDLQRFVDLPQRDVMREEHSARYCRAVFRVDDGCMGHRGDLASDGYGVAEVLLPLLPAAAASGKSAVCQRRRPRRSHAEIVFDVFALG